MSVIQSGPDPSQQTVIEASPTPRWIIAAFVVVLGLLGYVTYQGYATRTKLEADLAKSQEQTKVLAAQIDQTNERLAQLNGKVQVTSQKLGLTQEELARARSLAQEVRKQQQESDSRLGSQIGQVKQESEAKIGAVSTELGGAKTDIEATKKDLEATKAKLTSAVGDLGGHSVLIARNAEELETLKRLGERNINEFTLSSKTKQPQRVGPIQMQLKKVDPKSYRYTVNVYADDKLVEKKDKTVNEPVQFYVRGARAPYEIVVFEASKDTIKGYLSTPKEGGAAPAKQ
jgi:TolA-binding protein